MHHDLDPYVEAIDPPTASLNGETWVGRFVSIDEWLVLNDRLTRYQKGALSPAQIRALVRELCDRMFPEAQQAGFVPAWHFWRWREKRKRRLSAVVLELPFKVQLKVVGDFMESQAEALELDPATTTTRESEPATN